MLELKVNHTTVTIEDMKLTATRVINNKLTRVKVLLIHDFGDLVGVLGALGSMGDNQFKEAGESQDYSEFIDRVSKTPEEPVMVKELWMFCDNPEFAGTYYVGERRSKEDFSMSDDDPVAYLDDRGRPWLYAKPFN